MIKINELKHLVCCVFMIWGGRPWIRSYSGSSRNRTPAPPPPPIIDIFQMIFNPSITLSPSFSSSLSSSPVLSSHSPSHPSTPSASLCITRFFPPLPLSLHLPSILQMFSHPSAFELLFLLSPSSCRQCVTD